MLLTVALLLVGAALFILGLMWAFALGMSDNPADNESRLVLVALAFMALGASGVAWAAVRIVIALVRWIHG